MNDRVLVIDDNPSLLELTKEVLENHNYNVIVAPNGLSGIFLFKSCFNSISLVICDIQLPNITGFEVVSELRSIDPVVPILVWSGHDEMLEEMSKRGYPTLSKPFRLDQLTNLVKSLKREIPLP